MRLRRGSYPRRAPGESSTTSDAPPQLSLRGRARFTSAAGPSRLPESAQSSSARSRRIRGDDSTIASSVRNSFQDPFLRDIAMEVLQDATANFRERRRRAVRLHSDEASSSHSRIPTLLATAATVRARAILTEGRRSNRRNQSDGEEEHVSETTRPVVRAVLELLPGPRDGPTLEETARERARTERDRRNERRNRIMQAASSPNVEREIASVFSAIRHPAVFIDLTDDFDSPVVEPPAAAISSDSSSSATSSSSSSSSSDNSSQLASPLSAITSEEEAVNFAGAIGRRASSNEE